MGIETRFGSKEAKAYLKSRQNRKTNKRKLAVLPSLIENSPYAVYECAELGIPFLAVMSEYGDLRARIARCRHWLFEEDEYQEKMTITGESLAKRIREVLRVAR